MSEMMDRFEQFAYNEDYDEAYMIDRHFDRLREEYGTSELGLAEAAAGHELGPKDLRLSHKFGYETAKLARRWWNFRNAYINDLLPAYEESDEIARGLEATFGEHDFLVTQQQHAGNMYVNGDTNYVEFFEVVERIRAEAERRGQPLENPLETELQTSLKIVKHKLDEMVTDQDSMELNSGRMFKRNPNGHEQYFSVTREELPELTSYEVNIYDTGGPGYVNENCDPEPAKVYHLDKPANSDKLMSSVYVYGQPVKFDFCAALELLQELAELR